MQKPVRARPHRLPLGAYVGRKTVSFTACVHDRRPLFVDGEVVGAMLDLLRDATREHDCRVPVYCFMPDHIHLMVQGMSDHAAPKRAMDSFKYLAGRWLASHRPEVSLQSDYHDRIVRRTEDWRSHAVYILLNPVRAGLVSDPYQFPFSGSLDDDLVQVMLDAHW